jgi:Bacterial inner membrane protein
MYSVIATYFGYLASLMLIIALLVNTEFKFRWFNILGCIIFIVYAIIIGAFPVLLTNSILLFINVFYLFKLYNKKEYFDVVAFNHDDLLVHKFLDFYQSDISIYFPEVHKEQLIGNLNFVVIRDLVIANVFSATITQNGDAAVVLNYTIKKFRDFKVGPYIFNKEKDFLISKGVKRVVYKTTPYKKHLDYLKAIGFLEKEGMMVKEL